MPDLAMDWSGLPRLPSGAPGLDGAGTLWGATATVLRTAYEPAPGSMGVPTFSCPRCGAMNHAPSVDGLVCHACGYGGQAGLPAAASGFQDGPGAMAGAGSGPAEPEGQGDGPSVGAVPSRAASSAGASTASPVPTPGPAWGCPNCHTNLPRREKIATWALVLGITLTVVTFCPLFLLFFLAKERDCPVCGYRYP